MTCEGKITYEATVWCGKCSFWRQDTFVGIRQFSNDRKKEGWRKINKVWLCSECVRSLSIELPLP